MTTTILGLSAITIRLPPWSSTARSPQRSRRNLLRSMTPVSRTVGRLVSAGFIEPHELTAVAFYVAVLDHAEPCVEVGSGEPGRLGGRRPVARHDLFVDEIIRDRCERR